MEVRRLTPRGAARKVLASLVLLGTFVGCVWVGTYQELLPVGLRGYRYTPDWAVPEAVAIGVCGALLALVIYRQGRPKDQQGWLLLGGLLSAAFLAFGSLGPWIRPGFYGIAALQLGTRQHGLVLLAAVVGAVVLVVLRKRRLAGLAPLLGGLVALGVTLDAATNLNGLIPPYGPARQALGGFADVGWGLDLALLASLSFTLCGLIWLLVVADPPETSRLVNATPAPH